MIVPPRYGDAYISSLGCVLDRIVQEVHDYLLQPRGISIYLDGVSSITSHGNVLFLCQQLHLVSGCAR